MHHKLAIALIVITLVGCGNQPVNKESNYVPKPSPLLRVRRNPAEVLNDIKVLNENLLKIDRTNREVCSNEIDKYKSQFNTLKSEIYGYPIDFTGLASLQIIAMHLGVCMECNSEAIQNGCNQIKRMIPLTEEDLNRK